MKLTEVQVRGLQAIERGEVSLYRAWGGRKPPTYEVRTRVVNRGVVKRLVDAGLAELGRRRDPLFTEVVLTAAGQAALAARDDHDA